MFTEESSPAPSHSRSQARQPRVAPGTRVALKIQKPQYSKDARYEIEVYRQLGASARECPHIVPLLDHFECGEHVCMAMGLYGRELMGLIDEDRLTYAAIKRVTSQILTALVELHRLGIAHTDLKPENLLYSEADNRVAVIDFGSAGASIRKGESLGTREYRAPEIILGIQTGPPADVWSVACIVFEMLTAEYLFDPHYQIREKHSDTEQYRRAQELRRRCRDIERARAAAEAANGGASPYREGAMLGGKYRLLSVLGEGHFSTVWKAERIGEGEEAALPAADPDEATAGVDGVAEVSRSATEDPDEKKLREWGYVYDTALDYELLLEMQGVLGKLPQAFAREGVYFRNFHDEEGNFHFKPEFEVRTVGRLLHEEYGFSPRASEEIESFLLPMLTWDPGNRATAEACLKHPWLGV